MQVGYARVSTSEQSLAVQLDALQRHGCTKIFQEVASGAQAERQGLTAALAYVRPGDTLVVWRLDRLGRSLGQLIKPRHEILAASGNLSRLARAGKNPRLAAPVFLPV
jgi:DNA invertase Pin-like site-specific DNA recombinase